MSNVTDLTARRWQQGGDSTEHKPVDALREAIRQIEAGEIAAEQVFIAIAGRCEDCGDTTQTTWLTAGSFPKLAVIGLMESAKANFIGQP